MLLVGNFGMMIDDDTSRANGLVNAKYVLEFFKVDVENVTLLKDIEPLYEWKDRDYGAVLELVTVAFEFALNLESIQDVYMMRHITVFILFCISAIFFGEIFNLRYKSHSIYVLAVILYFTSPRIFGSAFFNSKDLGCLALTTISVSLLYIYAQKKQLWALVFSAVIVAMAINTRIIIALVPMVFVIICFTNFFMSKSWENLRVIFVYSTFSILFYYLFTPYLWESPIENTLSTIGNMSKFHRWAGETYFMGQWYRGGETPWSFLPVWIGITQDWPMLLGLTLGLSMPIIGWRSNWVGNYIKQDFILLGLGLIPLLIVLALNSVVYNDWRQFYFAHLPLCFLSVQGYVFLIKFSFLKIKHISFLVVTAVLALSVNTLIRFHPYQYCFFNPLVKAPHLLFEVDHYRMSYKQATESLIDKFPTQDYHRVYFHELRGVENGFSKEALKLVKSWEPMDSSDFVITNNKYHQGLYDGLLLVDETWVGNVLINQTYKVQE
ncbi:MAG TPA: hypothetical protein DCR04_10770 [Flavobacteriales bacterium]|nr:hypothetical protein [Flavobacteriales bacterium]